MVRSVGHRAPVGGGFLRYSAYGSLAGRPFVGRCHLSPAPAEGPVTTRTRVLGARPAELANRKRPLAYSCSSTACRTRSHTCGSSCHSYTNTGGWTWVIRSKFAATLARFRGSLDDKTVAARRLPVAVLPTPLAPSKATAARSVRVASSTSSMMRVRYSKLSNLVFGHHQTEHLDSVQLNIPTKLQQAFRRLLTARFDGRDGAADVTNRGVGGGSRTGGPVAQLRPTGGSAFRQHLRATTSDGAGLP